MFEEYADANVVEDARDLLHNTTLMGETIKVERRFIPPKMQRFLFVFRLVNLTYVTGNPSMCRCIPS